MTEILNSFFLFHCEFLSNNNSHISFYIILIIHFAVVTNVSESLDGTVLDFLRVAGLEMMRRMERYGTAADKEMCVEMFSDCFRHLTRIQGAR